MGGNREGWHRGGGQGVRFPGPLRTARLPRPGLGPGPFEGENSGWPGIGLGG